MKYLTFFIIFWTVVGFSWNSLNITLPKTRTWQAVEVFVLAPVIVWQWISFGFVSIRRYLNKR